MGLAHEQRHLIVDLAEVGMLDSSGLSALLATAIALRERGASLTVVAGSAQVMHGFELSGLDLLFRVEGSRGDAPAALRTAAAAP